jgi:hypothetical protein
LYKLLHQAILGSGHAISDLEGARKWLERELTEMDSRYDETAIDPISPDGEIVRVHLRPIIASVRAKHYPAVQHSVVYVSTYHPAYRVIWRKFIGG